MSTQAVKLIDDRQNVLAMAQVADEVAYYGGTVDLTRTPAGVRAIFEEFEEIVNSQVFSLLDEIQDKISALGIKAVFEDGHQAPVADLQIFPSTGELSFKLAATPVEGRNGPIAGSRQAAMGPAGQS